ncbi:MAG: hypothetical protein IKY21_00555 [Clostridia bacterium]|nr:hypothetical protein [Clostridia bacterium]
MKDVKVLRYYSQTAGADISFVKKVGSWGSLQENKAIEEFLLPYINEGYRIVQFNGNLNDCIIILQKD